MGKPEEETMDLTGKKVRERETGRQGGRECLLLPQALGKTENSLTISQLHQYFQVSSQREGGVYLCIISPFISWTTMRGSKVIYSASGQKIRKEGTSAVL